MDRFGTNAKEGSRSGRAAGVALSLSLHAGVAWAAWIGLATPEQTEPVPIAVRFIEVAPTVALPATPAPEAPAEVSAPAPAPAPEPAKTPVPEPARELAKAPVPEPPPELAKAPVPEPVPAIAEAPAPEPLPMAEAPVSTRATNARPAEPPKKVEAPRPARRVIRQPSRRIERVKPPPVAIATPAPVARPMPEVREPAPAAVPDTPGPERHDPPSPAPERPVDTGAPKPATPSVALAAPTSAPRFDAAYLRNPAPAYPRASRRLGEQGRVVLRVRVEADGRASRLEVQRSSGSPRLDDAALDAVRRWSFVAARRGDDKVAAWVLVPMEFRLNDS